MTSEEIRAAMDAHVAQMTDDWVDGQPPAPEPMTAEEKATDRNCISYWFPKLQSAGIPVPQTIIVKVEDGRDGWTLTELLDGKTPPIMDSVCESIHEAATQVGGYPAFIRTGKGSGKQEWEKTCYLDSIKAIPERISRLVNWSHCVDFFGLSHDVFAVRKLLPVKPLFRMTAYGNMPFVPEIWAFTKGGKVEGWQPYWPVESIRQGKPDNPDWVEGMDHVNGLLADAWEIHGRALAERVAAAFESDWSVDLLPAAGRWYVTDMALAARSFRDTENFRREI